VDDAKPETGDADIDANNDGELLDDVVVVVEELVGIGADIASTNTIARQEIDQRQ
jgi:hypothetical protein